MTITVQVPSVLRSCCDGKPEFALSARTMRAVLDQIEQTHPSLYRSICNETGEVRRHVNVFVNASLLPESEGLDTTLAPGDVVAFFQAVSGG